MASESLVRVLVTALDSYNKLRIVFIDTGKSFLELVRYVFTLSDGKSFLSQRICQDPLENFFGRQRQRGGVHDNPKVKEFLENTQALRVIKMTKFSTVRGETAEEGRRS